MDSSPPERPRVVEVLTLALQRDSRILQDELTHCQGKLKTQRVHAMRTAIRRLLAAFELACVLGAEPKPRVVRRLIKLHTGLSPLRDSQVQQRALARMTGHGADVSALSAWVHSQEPGLSHEARRCLANFDAKELQRGVATVVRQLEATSTSERARYAAQTAVHGDLARRHLQVESRRKRALDEPRSLHRLRLALKSYRYGLAAVESALPAAAHGLSEAVTRLQDQLGRAHDAHVLARVAKSAKKSQRSRGAKRLSRDLEQQSRTAQRAAAEAVNSAVLDWPL
ncbi:MAG TPA: CHAD domain-containing protein [Polyangiaceae bacterium]|nr:CHAD domain-containing protein [Polyangiaceae bacterium]